MNIVRILDETLHQLSSLIPIGVSFPEFTSLFVTVACSCLDFEKLVAALPTVLRPSDVAAAQAKAVSISKRLARRARGSEGGTRQPDGRGDDELRAQLAALEATVASAAGADVSMTFSPSDMSRTPVSV